MGAAFCFQLLPGTISGQRISLCLFSITSQVRFRKLKSAALGGKLNAKRLPLNAYLTAERL
jgi:hypothetical protein